MSMSLDIRSAISISTATGIVEGIVVGAQSGMRTGTRMGTKEVDPDRLPCLYMARELLTMPATTVVGFHKNANT